MTTTNSRLASAIGIPYESIEGVGIVGATRRIDVERKALDGELIALRSRLARLRHDADVGLGRFPALRILLLSFLVRHRAGDDHILAVLPVHRRRHFVLRGELQ